MILHTDETDAIIRKHGTEIGKAVTELSQFGGGWYWRKIRDRAVELGILSSDAIILGQSGNKVCVHTDETDAIIRKHNGNIKAACLELKWGNNRAVRARAIELGVIEDVKRKGGPPIKYIPTPETDAVLFKYPQQLKKCATTLKWDVQAVRRRMVELGIIKAGRKVKRKLKYANTKKTDELIRQYKGHTATLEEILNWPGEVILKRAIELGVRKKGEHLPKDVKYINWTAIDEVIIKYNGFVIPIQNETGWGKQAIRKRADQLGVSPKQRNEKYTYQKLYIPTDEVDAIIRETYSEKYHNGGALLRAVERIKEHAKKTKTPIWSESAVTKRALELGLVKGRKTYGGSYWQDDENQILLDNAHLTISSIQRKLHEKFPFSNRTQGAIKGQLSRLQAEYGKEGYTLNELSTHLHLSDRTLLKLTAQGTLKGTCRDTNRTESQGDLWHFSEKAVREFILEYPDEIDIAVMNKYWLLDLVSGGKLGKKGRDEEIRRTNKQFYVT